MSITLAEIIRSIAEGLWMGKKDGEAGYGRPGRAPQDNPQGFQQTGQFPQQPLYEQGSLVHRHTIRAPREDRE